MGNTVVAEALKSLDKAHASCTEPTLLKLTFNIGGQDKVVATVSTQPRPTKRQRRDAHGEPLGGFSAHLLYRFIKTINFFTCSVPHTIPRPRYPSPFESWVALTLNS